MFVRHKISRETLAGRIIKNICKSFQRVDELRPPRIRLRPLIRRINGAVLFIEGLFNVQVPVIECILEERVPFEDLLKLCCAEIFPDRWKYFIRVSNQAFNAENRKMNVSHTSGVDE